MKFASRNVSANAAVLNRTPVKPRWLRVQDGSYSSDQLRAILGAHGLVEDVVLLEQKKRSKASAVVVMSTADGAAAAASSRNGDADNTLLVVPFLKARSCALRKLFAWPSVESATLHGVHGTTDISGTQTHFYHCG